MVVEIRQRIGEDLYILFEDGKFKYDISLFDDLAGKYVYATGSEKDSSDFFITEDDYAYLEEGGNNYIEFVAGFPVDQFFSFKVLDVKPDFDRVASIVDMADINPNNLNAEFDNIKDYMFLIQEIISKKTFRYDAEFDLTMLPKLKTGEFWLKTETGFRASNFETLEALIETAFKDFFGIIGGENFSFTFTGVTALDGDWIATDTLGVNVVDGIAVQSGDSFGTYYVLTSGFVLIPDDELDDLGNPFVTNSYYYQSLTTTGKFSTICPVSGICKKVFKVIEAEVEAEAIQYALILNYPHTVGNGTEFSEFIKYYNVNADMIADLTLGVNQRVDVGAELYKIVAGVQPIALDNGLYAELLENVQVGTNKTNISTNVTNIGNNTTAIGINITNIGLNTDAIDDNTSDIADIIATTGYACIVNATGTGAENEIVDVNLPVNIANNNRYVLTNPFGINKVVIVIAEVFLNSRWAVTGFSIISESSSSYTPRGTMASYVQGEGIIVQTGTTAVASSSKTTGSGHDSTVLSTATAPCRIHVWRVGV